MTCTPDAGQRGGGAAGSSCRRRPCSPTASPPTPTSPGRGSGRWARSWQTYDDPQSGQQITVWLGHYTYPRHQPELHPDLLKRDIRSDDAEHRHCPRRAGARAASGAADAQTVQVQIKYATPAIGLQGVGHASPSSTADDLGKATPGTAWRAWPSRATGRGPPPATRTKGLSWQFCAGCATEDVVTPHASFIALDVAPQQAYDNRSRRCAPIIRGCTGLSASSTRTVAPRVGRSAHRGLVLDPVDDRHGVPGQGA